MSIETLSKELNRLTYSEMMILVRTINQNLETGLSYETIANALSEVAAELCSKPNVGEEKEIALLRKVFARKRAINISVVNGVFKVEVSSGIQTSSPSLNTALLQMIDQLVATQAMGLKP